MTNARYQCPACGTFTNSIRCPQCGSDADEIATDTVPHGAPRDYSPFALRVDMAADDLLTERYLKATERRFTGEPITGFQGLSC